ncbi:MAG: pentapeptide repeat-containing protein [candidate division WOR-3 bacterium]
MSGPTCAICKRPAWGEEAEREWRHEFKREKIRGHFCVYHHPNHEAKQTDFWTEFNEEFRPHKGNAITHPSGKLDFSNFIFPDADFQGAKFQGGADFWEAEFQGGAIFREAKFQGGADFWEAKFQGGAIFIGASVSSLLSFRSTIFSGLADFRGAELTTGQPTYGRIIFDSIEIPDPAKLVLMGITNPDPNNCGIAFWMTRTPIVRGAEIRGTTLFGKGGKMAALEDYANEWIKKEVILSPDVLIFDSQHTPLV